MPTLYEPWKIAQTNITPVEKKMEDILTLADLMETRNRKKKVRDIFAQPEAPVLETPTYQVPPTAAIQPTPAVQAPIAQAPAIQPTQPTQPMQTYDVQQRTDQPYNELMNKMRAEGQHTPMDTVTQQLTEDIGKEQAQQALTELYKNNGQLQTPAPVQPVQPQAPAVQAPAVQAPAVQAPAVQAPAVQAPAAQQPQGAYNDMPATGLSKSDMNKYNQLLKVDPDYAEAWAGKKIEQNYKIWQMRKQEADIKKEEVANKAKGLSLYATGMSAFITPDSEYSLQSPEAVQAHNTLRQMVIDMTGSSAGIPEVTDPKQLGKAEGIIMTYMDPLKRAEVASKRAGTKLTGAKTLETETNTSLIRDKFAEQIRLDDAKIWALMHPKAGVGGLNAPPTDEETSQVNNAITNGLDPKWLNSRTVHIFAALQSQNPDRQWTDLHAQAVYNSSSGVSNTKALLNSVSNDQGTGILDQLLEKGKALGNSKFVAFNTAKNWIKQQTGDPDIVAFNNMRDGAIAEVERGLLGTGVLSDSKYLIERKNISNAASLDQLKAAIANTKAIIAARLEAVRAGPYPEARGNTIKPTPATPAKKMTQEEFNKRYK